MKRIRVLFFVSTLGQGGAEKHFLRVMNHLDSEEFDVHLAVANPFGSYESSLASHVTLHHLNRAKQRSSTFGLLRSAPALRRLLVTLRPDVLCGTQERSSVVAGAVLRTMGSRPRFVACVQNNPVEQFVKRRRVDSRVVYAGLHAVLPTADKVVALSQGVESELRALVPKAANNLSMIYNAGLDDSVFELAQETLPPGLVAPPNLVVACGRLVEQKGYPYLLEALAVVRKEIPASLWILGDGPLRQELSAMAQSLGIEESVHFLGFVSNPFRFMARADLYVLSSLFEGFGNVVTEAMAVGAPVVSTRCPYGPDEIIENGVSGLLVPVADSSALASAMIQALRSAELRRQLSAAARERARAFHARTSADSYAACFRSLVEASSKAPAGSSPRGGGRGTQTAAVDRA